MCTRALLTVFAPGRFGTGTPAFLALVSPIATACLADRLRAAFPHMFEFFPHVGPGFPGRHFLRFVLDA